MTDTRCAIEECVSWITQLKKLLKALSKRSGPEQDHPIAQLNYCADDHASLTMACERDTVDRMKGSVRNR
jgi:hypothetical protein